MSAKTSRYQSQERYLNSLDGYPATSSAILKFIDRLTAQAAFQLIQYPFPRKFSPTLLDADEVSSDILWTNIGLGCWQRYLRIIIVSSVMVCLTLLWVIPVAFARALSQISYLQHYFWWGGQIESLPGWLVKIIQGVAPQVISATLMIIFPFLLRSLVRQLGLFTRAAFETYQLTLRRGEYCDMRCRWCITEFTEEGRCAELVFTRQCVKQTRLRSSEGRSRLGPTRCLPLHSTHPQMPMLF